MTSSTGSQTESSQNSPQNSQWENLRQNIGTWNGTFMQFSPEGKPVKETPSQLTLEETEAGKTIALTLTREPADEPKKVNHLTFTYPGPAPAVYFFESGTFAQGSSQWSSFGQFGTEASLNVGVGEASPGENRRLRYVVMYEGTPSYTSKLKYVTLIPETQAEGTDFDEPHTTAQQLSGEWKGNAQVLTAATGKFTTGDSHWQLNDSTTLKCKEQLASEEQILKLLENGDSDSSSGENLIDLKNEESNALNYQLMLLPKGGYCLLPQEIRRETAFRIEVGWLRTDGHRTRLIRYYNTRGVWMHSALIEDQRESA